MFHAKPFIDISLVYLVSYFSLMRTIKDLIALFY